MLTSFNPTKPTTNVRNATMPVTKHGKRYGCVTKKCPNECGHLVAGLLKIPPMIGLRRRLAPISCAFQIFTHPSVIPALHMIGIRAKASPMFVASVN